ncbi:MAG TPA: type I methionyl aminopeptidase [Candidatus Limnocylindrales bacterium]|nr:type I methionyl aminopeptidase [Candidatus Limnocylindrales bacterium]
MITLKTKDETAKMREAGLIVAEILASCRAAVKPGVTTGELDDIAAEILRKRGARSNFKGYGVPVLPPFPGVICTSVNDQIVHGIPGKRKLKEGEIVSIDAGAIVDGWHADAAVTVAVGKVSPEAQKLIAVTEEALRRGIASAQVGKRLGDIGATVQKWVESQGFSIVRNYVGHGIGRAMHEEPQVPNSGAAERGLQIKEGLCIAIEPMVNIKGAGTRTLDDQWTVVTADGSLSAHFEHSLWCTASGPVVLTAPEGKAAVAA